jgi:O-antigen/teichoic acid export membrane protein
MLVWFLGDKFEHAGSVMRAFSPIFLLSSFNHAMVVYLLLPARLDKRISYVGISVAIFGGILMIFAAHYLGAVGIAWSRVAAEAFSAMLLIWAYKASRSPN